MVTDCFEFFNPPANLEIQLFMHWTDVGIEKKMAVDAMPLISDWPCWDYVEQQQLVPVMLVFCSLSLYAVSTWGLKFVREGDDYYLVHQGEIQRHLGSRKSRKGATGNSNLKREFIGEIPSGAEEPCLGILDKILFFIGDLEVASRDIKRTRLL
uniref:Uncharacterized protein n=1 Tax=Nelumbo nucifera TaxID=4432 RepID=A0A822XCU7_NELNU|nr:TPA_asm: hypothetical protein HUJ06_019460 [Nelumbo nucifera]